MEYDIEDYDFDEVSQILFLKDKVTQQISNTVVLINSKGYSSNKDLGFIDLMTTNQKFFSIDHNGENSNPFRSILQL